MDNLTLSILAIVVLVALIMLKMPVGFSLLFVGLTGIAYAGSFDAALATLYSMPYERNASWMLICVPLFVLAGQLSMEAGISDDAFEIGRKLVGRLPGGLAIGSIMGCAAFAATSGSSVATAAAMAGIAIPEMKKSGYDMKLAAGSVAAGGLLGIMIPPSVPMVIYGFITQNSVGRLLLAGFIPGLMTAAVFSVGIICIVLARPHLAPLGPKVPMIEKLKALPKAWRFIVVFLVIIGGIYSGFATVTEAAAGGAFVAFLMLLYKRRKDSWKAIKDSLYSTGTITTMVFTIILGATAFTIFMALTQFPQNVTLFLSSLKVHPQFVTLALLAIYIPLGMLLDVISMLLITLPIVYPIVQFYHIDPIWFGILVVKMCEIGLITPPVGINVFVIKGYTPELDLYDVFKGAYPFLILEFISLTILFLFPQMVLFIPNLMK